MSLYKSFTFFFGFILAGSVYGQSLNLVTDQSTVAFKIKSWGLNVDGKFGGIKLVGTWDEKELSNCSFDASVQSKTVDANIDARNESLRGAEYFHVSQYPEIKIKSSSIKKTDSGFLLKGTLTMKGVTKEVAIPFTANHQNNIYVFKGSFKVNRLDYHVGESSMIMGDDATISLIITAKVDP